VKKERKRLKMADANIHIREKPERGHDGSKPVTAKCCRALLSFNKVDVNYIATSTFLVVLNNVHNKK